MPRRSVPRISDLSEEARSDPSCVGGLLGGNADLQEHPSYPSSNSSPLKMGTPAGSLEIPIGNPPFLRGENASFSDGSKSLGSPLFISHKQVIWKESYKPILKETYDHHAYEPLTKWYDPPSRGFWQR